MRRFLPILILCLSGAVVPARAATATVSIRGFSFEPGTLSVEPGDAVVWTNNDPAPHTVTAGNGLFGSGVLEQRATFTFTFTEAGVYGYFCSIHRHMVGSVRVGAAATAPTRPTELTASPSLLPGRIDVSWRPPSDDGGSPVLFYRLCRGTTATDVTQCMPVADLSSVQSGLQILTTYYFSVTATNAVGESPATDVVCAKAGPWVSALGC